MKYEIKQCSDGRYYVGFWDADGEWWDADFEGFIDEPAARAFLTEIEPENKAETFTIRTECGLMKIRASSVEKAKAIYAAAHDFDFETVSECEGSWYWIEDEDGDRIEQDTEDMP